VAGGRGSIGASFLSLTVVAEPHRARDQNEDHDMWLCRNLILAQTLIQQL
jgi:hypothetical protein